MHWYKTTSHPHTIRQTSASIKWIVLRLWNRAKFGDNKNKTVLVTWSAPLCICINDKVFTENMLLIQCRELNCSAQQEKISCCCLHHLSAALLQTAKGMSWRRPRLQGQKIHSLSWRSCIVPYRTWMSSRTPLWCKENHLTSTFPQ